ncbi:hypothetical protein GCM10027194_35570 [Thalassiella azotivora]
MREVVAHMDVEPAVAVVPGVAQAINFSHPREPAALVEDFVDDKLPTSRANPSASPPAGRGSTIGWATADATCVSVNRRRHVEAGAGRLPSLPPVLQSV